MLRARNKLYSAKMAESNGNAKTLFKISNLSNLASKPTPPALLPYYLINDGVRMMRIRCAYKRRRWRFHL